MLLVNSIRSVATGLNSLGIEFVFVGGAVVECYATSTVAEQARFTDDIDVVLELAHYGEYAHLQERLIASGFNPDHTSKIICRYQYKGIKVDIMPDDVNVLGFVNAWYKEGIKTSINYRIDESQEIKIFTAPLYLASKVQAYQQRGARDKRLSTDFEDVIYVIENRKELIDEIARSTERVKKYLAGFFKNLMKERDLDEAINAVIGYTTMPARSRSIKDSIERLSQL